MGPHCFLGLSPKDFVNAAGLALGMIGVVIIFLYGPPQPTFEQGEALGLEDGNVLSDGRTIGQRNKDNRRARARFSRNSKIGLGLVFVGFALQFAAGWF